jgi:hypothetical protein
MLLNVQIARRRIPFSVVQIFGGEMCRRVEK